MSDRPGFVLRYRLGEAAWKDYALTAAALLIGRAADCDLRLDHSEVSRYHASLKVEAEGVSLMDMGSSNGTQVEGRGLDPNHWSPLPRGRSFTIGPFTLLLDAAAADPAAAHTVLAARRPKPYDVAALRQAEFPRNCERAYLNNAYVSPLPVRTHAKMAWFADELQAHISNRLRSEVIGMFGVYQSTLARFVNAAAPAEIVVADSISQGMNSIAQALALRPGDNVVFCNIEFLAVAFPWLSLQRDGIVVKQVPPVHGGLTLDALQAVVDERTRVVAASSVQFITGHRTDLAAIGQFCRERGIIFVVDAIQSVGHAPFDVQQMGIDVLISGGHKSLLAGTGIGFMYVRDAVCETLRPRLIGTNGTLNWGDYQNYDVSPAAGARRFWLGTPNIGGMFAVLESVGLLNELTREAIDQHTTQLAAYAIDQAEALGYELATVRGEHGPIVIFKSGLDGAQTDTLVQALDDQHVHVAKEIDRNGAAYLRISLHCYNNQDDIDRLFTALKQDR